MDHAQLELRQGYWSEREAKAGFCQLIQEIFGLDFGAWDSNGFWDENYRPFTFFDLRGQAVASVCLYAMTLVVGGEARTVGQLSAVATRPEWRRRGLALRLAGEALAWSERAGHTWQYLFSDDEARPFYRKLGFVPFEERVTTIDLTGRGPVPGARRLDTADPDDRALVHRLARARVPVSERLGVLNDRLVMFYALGGMREALWFIEPLDVVVLARRSERTLTIFDVIGRRIPALVDIHPFLTHPSDLRVLIRFEPDQLGELGSLGRVRTQPLLGNNLHVRGEFPLPCPVVFPVTAQA